MEDGTVAGGPPDPQAWHAHLARNHDLARNSNPRIGMAYDVQLRTDPEPRSSTSRKTPALQRVLSFRLRRVGPDGELLAPVAVEMRGSAVTGTVSEGDLVQVPKTAPPVGSLKHGGALKLASVTNLTTGWEVHTDATAGLRMLKVVLAVLLGLAAVGVVLVAVFLVGLTAGL